MWAGGEATLCQVTYDTLDRRLSTASSRLTSYTRDVTSRDNATSRATSWAASRHTRDTPATQQTASRPTSHGVHATGGHVTGGVHVNNAHVNNAHVGGAHVNNTNAGGGNQAGIETMSMYSSTSYYDALRQWYWDQATTRVSKDKRKRKREGDKER